MGSGYEMLPLPPTRCGGLAHSRNRLIVRLSSPRRQTSRTKSALGVVINLVTDAIKAMALVADWSRQ